jgi:hypothetical protein
LPSNGIHRGQLGAGAIEGRDRVEWVLAQRRFHDPKRAGSVPAEEGVLQGKLRGVCQRVSWELTPLAYPDGEAALSLGFGELPSSLSQPS